MGMPISICTTREEVGASAELGDGPGSDHSISPHSDTMSEVSQFSMAFSARGWATKICHQGHNSALSCLPQLLSM